MRVLRSAVVLCGPLLALQQQAFAQPYTCDNTGILGPFSDTADADSSDSNRVAKGRCLFANRNQACTSNRVQLGTVTNIELITACSTPVGSSSAEVKFFADVNFIGTSDESYDVGLHLGPTNTGLCYKVGFTCDGNTDFQLDGDDVCDDINAGSSTFTRVELTAPCDEGGGDLDIPYCISWENNQGVLCSSVAQIGPSTTSMCNCPSDSSLVVEEQCLTNYVVETTCVVDEDTGLYTDTSVTITGGLSGQTISYALVDEGDSAPTDSSAYGDYTGPFIIPGLDDSKFLAVEGCGIVAEIIPGCIPCVDDAQCSSFPDLPNCCLDKNICVSDEDFSPSACGDPHMTGFHGQKFDFTGEDGQWYALIADGDININMRVTTPVVDLPEITYITGLSVLTTDADGFDHSIVIEVKDPHTLDSSCPAGVSPCLADGSLTVLLDGEEKLLSPGTVSLAEGVQISAANLPGACRSFGFEQYWELKKLEYAAHARRLGESLTMAEWILGDPTATNMAECEEYMARAEAQDGGVFSHQSEHASFQIVTPKGTIRLSHGKLHQIAMRDPTDQYDLPDHLTWQMNMAIDHNEVSHDARGILGETFVPTRDAAGKPIMTGMEAIRGTQADYRVEGAHGMEFVQDARSS